MVRVWCGVGAGVQLRKCGLCVVADGRRSAIATSSPMGLQGVAL